MWKRWGRPELRQGGEQWRKNPETEETFQTCTFTHSIPQIFLNTCGFRTEEDQHEQYSHGPCPLGTHSLMGEMDVHKIIIPIKVGEEIRKMWQRSSNGCVRVGGVDQVWKPEKLPWGRGVRMRRVNQVEVDWKRVAKSALGRGNSRWKGPGARQGRDTGF